MSGPREQPTLATARLRLRPFTLEDAPRVRALAGVFEVADTTLNIPHPYPEGAAEWWIGTHAPAWEEGRGVTYAIDERAGDALVGAIGLLIAAADRSAEMGYWIARDRWGRGYATEAALALLDFAFGTLALERVHARHLVRNPASGRVLQKTGMRSIGARSVVRKGDREEEVHEYEIRAPGE